MSAIAFIEEPKIIDKIISHLKLTYRYGVQWNPRPAQHFVSPPSGHLATLSLADHVLGIRRNRHPCVDKQIQQPTAD